MGVKPDLDEQGHLIERIKELLNIEARAGRVYFTGPCGRRYKVNAGTCVYLCEQLLAAAAVAQAKQVEIDRYFMALNG